MKKNFLLLEALNDIDDDLLIQIDGEDMKHYNKKKQYMIYIFKYMSIVAIFVFSILTFHTFNKSNFKNKPINPIEIIGEEIATDININSYISNNIDSVDIAGKWVDANLMKELNIKNEIKVPNDFQLIRQGKIFIRESQDDNDYNKFQEYSLMYANEDNDIVGTIEIYFSKNKLLSNSCIYNANLLNGAKESVINETKLKIFECENYLEASKINGFAILECNKYNIFIRVNALTHEDFIVSLNSIINFFKTNNF